MKVLLVQPPGIENRTIGPPLGLGYLASVLERNGHEVDIVESIILRYNLKDIEQRIKRFDPDIVGASSVTQCIYDSMKIMEIVKKNNPNCMTVLGGPHPSLKAKETLEECSYVDVIVRGEGEITFLELLKEMNAGNLTAIRGISFRFDGSIRENESRAFIEDLDTLPFPAFHLFSMDKYKIKDRLFDIGLLGKQGQQYGTISTVRGCPFNCVFCSSSIMSGSKWRARSPGNVIEELKILRYEYGKKVIDFMDDTFTFDKKRTQRICKLIKEEKIDISWICTTRVDCFDREIAYSLKKAGCKLVFFGIEAGVQKTLDFLKKGFRLEDSVRAVKIAKEVNIDVAGSFIIGIPGETREQIDKTIAFAKRLDMKSVRFPLLIPFPNTRLYKFAEENNLLHSGDWTSYTYSNPVLKIPNFTSGELKLLQIKAGFFSNLKTSSLSQIFHGIIP